MPGTAEDRILRGRRIAFTGQLASMTQAEAEELVRTRGGSAVSSPGASTDYLVVGQEGWPLRGDGFISRKLAKAMELRRKGHAIEILREEEFLEKIGLDGREEHIRCLYTLSQLSRILGIPRDRLRRWVRRGFIVPSKTVHRLSYFDFSQVASAKALWKLVRAGIPMERIRRSLAQLRTWNPDVDNPLARLPLVGHDRHILIRLENQRIADPRGQLYFGFAEFAPGTTVMEERPIELPVGAPSAAEWFEVGLRFEEEGRLPEAERAYLESLRVSGPEPETCFNLGNVLYGLGSRKAAAERFLEAVELDPRYVEAWNNLGNVLAELGEWNEAISAYGKALEVEPLYADAHYNLAEVLSQRGRLEEARDHWAAYLRLDRHSSWADHARRQLEGR